MTDDDLVRRKDALLEAALPNVLFDGWSRAALKAGADILGLPAADVATLFPGGPGEAMLWLDDWADRRMLHRLERIDLAALKTRARVAEAITARLDVLAPHREAVRRAISTKFSPFGAAHAARAIYRTVDAIWYAAGDASTDFNFYTKRGLLAAVYAATMLYWLNDGSGGAAETHRFLEKRLDEVMKIPSLTNGLRQALRRFMPPVELLRR